MPGAAHAGMIGQRLDLSFYFIPFTAPNVNKKNIVKSFSEFSEIFILWGGNPPFESF